MCVWFQGSLQPWSYWLFVVRVNEGLFGFTVFITHNSVFLPHNSKYVSPMKKKKTLLGFVFSFCFYHSILWFLSNKLWKLKTYFRCFWFPKLSFQWHFHNLTHITSCNVRQTDWFFFFWWNPAATFEIEKWVMS